MESLPIHLWCSSVFKDIGDICSGIVEIDDNWGGPWQCVRLRIKEGGHVPLVVKVHSGKDMYQVQVIGHGHQHSSKDGAKQSEAGLLKEATDKLKTAEPGWRKMGRNGF